MQKKEALNRWRNLPANQNPLPLMGVIPYKTRGSRYGCCGIRIDGTPEFVDAVLSCLKSLLPGENQITRLELSRSPVKGEPGRFENAEQGAEVCYVRLHQRGGEGTIAAALFREMETETDEFLAQRRRA